MGRYVPFAVGMPWETYLNEGEGGKEIGDGTGVKVSVSSASERSWVEGDAFSMGRKGVVVLC